MARLGSGHRLHRSCISSVASCLFICLFSAAVPPPPSPPPLLPVPLDPHNPVQLGVTRYSTGTAAAADQPAPCSGEQLQSCSAACILQQAAGSAPSRPDRTLRGGERGAEESLHRPRLLLIYGRHTWLDSPHGLVMSAAVAVRESAKGRKQTAVGADIWGKLKLRSGPTGTHRRRFPAADDTPGLCCSVTCSQTILYRHRVGLCRSAACLRNMCIFIQQLHTHRVCV